MSGLKQRLTAEEIENLENGLAIIPIKDNKNMCYTGSEYDDTTTERPTKEAKPNHYDNSKGSIYKFAEDQKLNPYEFDIIKRIVRCRKKGNFKEDLEKTKFLIELYLKEFKN